MFLNLLIPAISFFITSLISLYMTPFFISHFGYDGLGIITNSNSIVQALFFTSGSFISVYSRQYILSSINEKNDILQELDLILNIISLISFSMFIFLIFYSTTQDGDIKYLYYSMIFLASIFIIKSQLYSIIPFSTHKIYISTIFDNSRTIIRNISCIFLVTIGYNSVLVNGYATIASGIIILFVWSKLYPIKKSLFKKIKISSNENIKNASWVCVNQGGAYIFSFSDIIFINVFLGNYIGGIYALMIQIPILLKSISLVVINGISSISISLIKSEKIDINKKENVILKLYFLFSFIVSFPFFFLFNFKSQIFDIWIGNSLPFSLESSTFFIICALIMTLSITSIVNIFLVACGIFATPAKLTIIFSLISVVLCLTYYFTINKVEFIIIFLFIYTSLLLKNILCMAILSKALTNSFRLFLKMALILVFTIIANALIFKMITTSSDNIYLSLTTILLYGITTFYLIYHLTMKSITRLRII